MVVWNAFSNSEFWFVYFESRFLFVFCQFDETGCFHVLCLKFQVCNPGFQDSIYGFNYVAWRIYKNKSTYYGLKLRFISSDIWGKDCGYFLVIHKRASTSTVLTLKTKLKQAVLLQNHSRLANVICL